MLNFSIVDGATRPAVIVGLATLWAFARPGVSRKVSSIWKLARYWRTLLPWILLLGFTGWVWTVLFTFHSRCYCTICGMKRLSVEWQVPFRDVTLLRSDTISSTRLSQVAAELGLTTEHLHSWGGAGGVGNMSRACGGSGMGAFCSTDSDHVIALLCNLAADHGLDESRMWLRIAVGPRQGGCLLSGDLREQGFPETGFADPAEFHRWWAQHRTMLESDLRQIGRLEPELEGR